MSQVKPTNIYETLREGVTLMGDAMKSVSRAEQFFSELVGKATLIKNASPVEIEKEIAPVWASSIGAVPSGLGVLIRTFGEFALLNNDSKFTAYFDAFKVIVRCDSTKVADVLVKFKTQRGAYNAFVALTKPAKAVVVQTPAEVSAELQAKAFATSKATTVVLASVQVEVVAGRMTADGKAYLESLVAAGKTAALLLTA